MSPTIINKKVTLPSDREYEKSYETFAILQNESKGGFPVMAETTRNHIFSKEISQVIIADMVLAPNFY